MKPRALGLGPLIAVMFFIVSGGPFGLEGLVGATGPAIALILLVATPLVYSVPEAILDDGESRYHSRIFIHDGDASDVRAVRWRRRAAKGQPEQP